MSVDGGQGVYGHIHSNQLVYVYVYMHVYMQSLVASQQRFHAMK